MNYFPAYRRKLVGGFMPTPANRIRPGQVIIFNYPKERSTPKSGGSAAIPRIVLVLNRRFGGNKKSGPEGRVGMKLHALNLEYIPWLKFRTFMKQLITQDTLTLIKRRLEIRAPINELIDRPLSFYSSWIRPQLIKHLTYRTYYTKYMKSVRVAALDYKTMFSYTSEARDLLIEKNDVLKNIPAEEKILNQIIDVKTNRLKDAKFKKLIMDRFGSVASFVRAVKDIETYIDETTETLDDEDFKSK